MSSQIDQLIKRSYTESNQELTLGLNMMTQESHADCWRSVINHKNWEMLNSLNLGKYGKTKINAQLQMRTSKFSPANSGQI
jgi:hypothetical protein